MVPEETERWDPFHRTNRHGERAELGTIDEDDVVTPGQACDDGSRESKRFQPALGHEFEEAGYLHGATGSGELSLHGAGIPVEDFDRVASFDEASDRVDEGPLPPGSREQIGIGREDAQGYGRPGYELTDSWLTLACVPSLQRRRSGASR
jgi:hypothetical protein